MSRVTKAFGERASQWEFSGNELINGQFKPMAIPGLQISDFGTKPTLVNFRLQFPMIATIEPQVSAIDDLTFAAMTPNNLMASADSGKIAASVSAAYRIENPKFHSPDTTDCISCHIARQVINKSQNFVVGQDFSTSAYLNDSGFSAELAYPQSIEFVNVRAFGYFGTKPTIIPRVVNETLEIVKFLKMQ